MNWPWIPRRSRAVGLLVLALISLSVLAVWPRDHAEPSGRAVPRAAERAVVAEDWLRRGDRALRNHRLNEAESAFQQTLTLDLEIGPARLGLAWIYTMTMRRDQALAAFSAANAVRPLDAGQVLVWTQVRCGMWDADKVVDPLSDCLAAEPDGLWTRLALAEGLRQAGRPDKAEVVLGPLKSDIVPEAAVVRARLALDRNDFQGAETILRSAPADHAGRAELEGKLAMARRDAGAAVRWFQSATAAAPDRRLAWLGLAQALRMAEQTESLPGVLAMLREMDRLDYLARTASETQHGGKVDGPLSRELGMACAALGYRDEARAWLGLAISADPLDTQSQAALYRLASPPSDRDKSSDQDVRSGKRH